jgi:glycerate kinase
LSAKIADKPRVLSLYCDEMRVLVAFDKFRGSLAARQACQACSRGLRATIPGLETRDCPLSDGGEGFLESLSAKFGGKRVQVPVIGPLPEQHITASYTILDTGEAVIEMAEASGLQLVPPALRDPLSSTSFGTGQLLRHAAEQGCRRVLLGIGGSATCDAGIGCLQAAGCHIVMSDGAYARPTEPLCARDLADVVMVKSHRGSPVDSCEIRVACDVDNPLLGPAGTARVFAPQKGASPPQVEQLERILESFAARTGTVANAALPMTGAAGGVGFGLKSFAGAELSRGIDLVFDWLGFRELVAWCDICVTGEGRLDAQTGAGKVVHGAAQLCQAHGKPCYAIAGEIDLDASALNRLGLSGWISLTQIAGGRDPMTEAADLLSEAASRVVRG